MFARWNRDCECELWKSGRTESSHRFDSFFQTKTERWFFVVSEVIRPERLLLLLLLLLILRVCRKCLSKDVVVFRLQQPTKRIGTAIHTTFLTLHDHIYWLSADELNALALALAVTDNTYYICTPAAFMCILNGLCGRVWHCSIPTDFRFWCNVYRLEQTVIPSDSRKEAPPRLTNYILSWWRT